MYNYVVGLKEYFKFWKQNRILNYKLISLHKLAITVKLECES